MSGKCAVCSVCPGENEQIEAVIKLQKERRAVIHGTVLDANGNMRPMNDIFNDLNGTLSTMTQGEQTQVLNKIFR